MAISILSTPRQELKSEYDAVVIGSGYGGSVSLARLALAGQSVCMLERGREYGPGDFPASLREASGEFQSNRLPETLDNRLGLMDVQVHEELAVWSGCGLGGSSLINAGVMVRPAREAMVDPVWPLKFRQDIDGSLEKGYRRGEYMLSAGTYPENTPGFPRLRKAESVSKAAEKLGTTTRPAPITVNFKQAGYNKHGVFQKPCVCCGNCMTGCNHEAKNSLDVNYLPLARENGAEIYTKVHVAYLEKRADGRWSVYYQFIEHGKQVLEESRLNTIIARTVVLGAGAPGSTEILMRSRQRGLSLSERLGERFSANGAGVITGFNSEIKANQVGFHKYSQADRREKSSSRNLPEPGAQTENQKKHRLERRKKKLNLSDRFREKVGPTITMLLLWRHKKNFEHSLMIEDAAISGAFSRPLTYLWIFAGLLETEGSRKNLKSDKFLRMFESVFRGSGEGAVAHSNVLLGVGHDDSGGRLLFKNDTPTLQERPEVYWPGLKKARWYRRLNKVFRKLLRVHGGTVTEVSIYTGGRQITVHPMGGCVMGETADSGVVNHASEVFNPRGGPEAVHTGLLVVDASLMPRSLGANPLATITAIAERAMDLYITKLQSSEEHQNLKKTRRPEPELSRRSGRGLGFNETMGGHWFDRPDLDYRSAERAGKNRGLGGEIKLLLDIEIDDLDDHLSDPAHPARVRGYVDAPGLCLAGRLPIEKGVFRLFTKPADHIETRFMEYDLVCINARNRRFRVLGTKEIRRSGPGQVYRELTTLPIQVFALPENEAGSDKPAVGSNKGRLEPEENLLGRGILYVNLADFISATVAGIRALDSVGALRKTELQARFIAFFSGEVLESVRPRAPLRTLGTGLPGAIARFSLEGIERAEIEEIPLLTEDNLTIKLTRAYRPETRGDSVLLIHGLSSSSDMFIMPEHKNLTNFLLDQGHQVWLLDFRMSCRFLYNSSPHDFSMDDPTLFDMPLALETIRNRIEPEARLHVIGHCLGAMSFSFALFAGLLKGVDDVILNAVSLIPRTPGFSRLKNQLFLKTGLVQNFLRIPWLAPDALSGDDWLQRALAKGVGLFHPECDNSVCHMLSFLWGSGNPGLFLHKNMHPITHERLGDLFGPVNYNYQSHIMDMGESGRVGKSKTDDPRFHRLPDDYLKVAHKNQTPVLFIAGSENKVFVDSNRVTFEFLQNKRPGLYELKLFPEYGHQDIFQGRDAARDIFPAFLDFWKRRS